MITHELEEVLENLWILIEEQGAPYATIEEISRNVGKDVSNLSNEAEKLELITMSRGRVKLTEKGRKGAREINRRHRLAERLLVDVLETKGKEVHDIACEFEHILPKGVTESICTLLGHPKICPHGNPIPSGKCCKEARETVERVVVPLSELEVGERGRITYLATSKHPRMQTLMSMGALPGIEVKLIQKFPSFVLQVEETEIALDKEIADEIYIRPM